MSALNATLNATVALVNATVNATANATVKAAAKGGIENVVIDWKVGGRGLLSLAAPPRRRGACQPISPA
jgi:hypothetical protein